MIGKLCDKEIVEPLHLRNNAVQHLHLLLLHLAISESKLPVKIENLSDLPENCAVTRYINALQNDVNAGKMKKQLVKWLLEDRAKEKEFSYRLTGKDSRLILHGFMYLINAIRGDSEDGTLICKLLFLAYIALKLRDCAAIFSMYHLPEEKLAELPSLAKD